MSHEPEQPKGPYGIIAEFLSPDALLRATERTRDAGYKKFEAYTPFPIHGLTDAMGYQDVRVKWIIFFGGIVGVIAGYGLQYWVSVYAYAHNVGGKPLHSWPAFIPVTFECMILFAAFGAVFGMLALNGLPRPHHPIFNAKRFHLASQDSFFLCIEADDPSFDVEEVSRFLRGLGAHEVSEVPYR